MLIQLAETRKKLLWLWLAFTVLIIGLVLVQTITGKYNGMKGTAWVWALGNLLPSLVLLYTTLLLNKNASKFIVSAAFWAIYVGALVYLLCLIAYLLATPFAMSNARLDDYLMQSFGFLVPFQLFLMGLFGLLYFREAPLFTPNAAIIGTYVNDKAVAAQGTGNLRQQQAFTALTQDADLSNVLTLLRAHLPEETSNIVLLQSRYATWQRDKNLDLAAPEVLQRQLNNLTCSIVHFIEKL